MKISISGFQGEGKSTTARNLAEQLHATGKTVRVIDGCNSHEFPEPKPRQKKLKVWDVNIRVRTIHPVAA